MGNKTIFSSYLGHQLTTYPGKAVARGGGGVGGEGGAGRQKLERIGGSNKQHGNPYQ